MRVGALPFAVLAMLPSSASAAGPTPPPARFAERLLDAHNRERRSVGVPPLKWSARLAADAQAWAAELARAGGLAHDENEASSEGENLWAGTRQGYSLEQMVGLWTAEGPRFRAGHGDVHDVGHYTQIVWRSTAKVGCALADDGADDYLVCRYDEGGNVDGEQPY